jgi:ammonia channel protein AmtB
VDIAPKGLFGPHKTRPIHISSKNDATPSKRNSVDNNPLHPRIIIMASLFEQCAERLGDGSNNNNSLLLCISDQYDVLARNETAAAQNTMNWLLTLCGGSVFFMQAGFAMVAAGAVRKKNVQNTMLKNLLDACGASLAFYIIGYGLAYGDNGRDDIVHNTFAGNSHFFGMDWRRDTGSFDFSIGFYFFQYAFSASSVTIVAGTLAERCRMGAYLLYSFYLPGWIFPVIVHAMWSDHGYLSPASPTPLRGVGVIDFAGSGVVHLTGGTVALVATLILGARQGRFRDAAGNLLTKPRDFPAHSLALQELGTFILWFGCTFDSTTPSDAGIMVGFSHTNLNLH